MKSTNKNSAEALAREARIRNIQNEIVVNIAALIASLSPRIAPRSKNVEGIEELRAAGERVRKGLIEHCLA